MLIARIQRELFAKTQKYNKPDQRVCVFSDAYLVLRPRAHEYSIFMNIQSVHTDLELWEINTSGAEIEKLREHDNVIKWKLFQRYWLFVRGIHRSRWIPRTKASDAELWCFL